MGTPTASRNCHSGKPFGCCTHTRSQNPTRPSRLLIALQNKGWERPPPIPPRFHDGSNGGSIPHKNHYRKHFGSVANRPSPGAWCCLRVLTQLVFAFLESVLWPGSPTAWFVSGLDLAADDKTLTEAVIGSVIVEAAEMVGAGRADLARMKAFATRQNDGHLRLAYRRNREPSARRSIIVGTANPSPAGILPNDPSGNTRFVVVDLPACRSLAGPVEAWISERRAQLWAEAAARYAAGERANLPEDLQPAAAAAAESHRRKDELLEDAIAGLPPERQDARGGRRSRRTGGRSGPGRASANAGRSTTRGSALGGGLGQAARPAGWPPRVAVASA